LTQARLVELARELGVSIPAGRKDAQIAKLIENARLPLPAWLGHLVRDELRAACRALGLDASSRSRSELAGALLDAAGLPRGRDTIRRSSMTRARVTCRAVATSSWCGTGSTWSTPCMPRLRGRMRHGSRPENDWFRIAVGRAGSTRSSSC
jgi:hypothetical protein